MSAHEWVENQFEPRLTLTPFQASAVNLLSAAMATGPWNLGVKWANVDWTYGRDGVRFVMRAIGGLSTYDHDHLTRLVVLAHDRCIRVRIEPIAFRYLAIICSPRDRDAATFMDGHPTIEAAIERIRPKQEAVE